MDEKILTTIKKLLGITDDYDHFDLDILVHINTAAMVLSQLGVGYGEIDDSTTWQKYLEDTTKFSAAKTYIYLRVRLLFDPPSSSGVIDSINRTISELEWRLNLNAETG